MEEQEKKAQRILRKELGNAYSGQSFGELEGSNYFSGFYLKICHEKCVEFRSGIFMELHTIEVRIQVDKKLIHLLTDDPYEAMKVNWYTGFTSAYVSHAIELKVDLNPDIISQLIEADEKRDTSIETILSRVSIKLKSIDNGQFLEGLQAKCSSKFVEVWKAWLDIYI